ncbi:hypothetical protein MPH_05762 [Macrophomina phaseolina MS6]|uniref:Uncharacterized protein n=1 Tax=Macrophomina phaseolina (strain MS6) TaxID=1126212 RepID=K2RWJ6_MACPH|nr:hypothetical protein MPH_05762 [Macrophomina phaseolina MS6]
MLQTQKKKTQTNDLLLKPLVRRYDQPPNIPYLPQLVGYGGGESAVSYHFESPNPSAEEHTVGSESGTGNSHGSPMSCPTSSDEDDSSGAEDHTSFYEQDGDNSMLKTYGWLGSVPECLSWTTRSL